MIDRALNSLLYYRWCARQPDAETSRDEAARHITAQLLNLDPVRLSAALDEDNPLLSIETRCQRIMEKASYA